MKVAIIGGRNFDNYQLLKETLNVYPDVITEIVSGGANGADYLAEVFADEFNIPIKIFEADWNNLEIKPCRIKYNKYGKPYNALAGFNRNKLIVDYADKILAFWDTKSPGTKNSIDYGKSIGREITIINY